MTSELTIVPCPDEQELARLLWEMGLLSEQVAALEQELTEEKLELSRFELRYYRLIGRRYAELDELKARIAEQRAARFPRDPRMDRQARRARSAADRTARFYGSAIDQSPVPPQGEQSEETKRLYRRIAAEIHPDKARDGRSRKLGTRLMSELNEAYALGDRQRMEEVLREWRSSPETVSGHDPASLLRRLRMTVARLKRRIEDLDRNFVHLRRSDLYTLMTRVRQACSSGRDLLEEMAEILDAEIDQARRELSRLNEEESIG